MKSCEKLRVFRFLGSDVSSWGLLGCNNM